MDPNVEFYIKMGLVFLCSGLIFVVMMRIQKRREEEAERKFRMFLKSKGMNPDIEEEK